jgi:methylenetetrahydrofolate reductase (NADPH)
MARAEGIDRQAHIIAGIIPLRSVKAARFMAGHVPGMLVPESVLDRMEKAADPREEGIRICLETLEEVRKMPGVHGVHLMPVAWESVLPRIVRDSGLYPRPTL